MTWECDYPHSDSDWPHSPERVVEAMRELEDETIHAITHENALRLFQHDPFRTRTREQCTVGALRAEAEAAGIDTALRSMRTRAQTLGTQANAQVDLYTPTRD